MMIKIKGVGRNKLAVGQLKACENRALWVMTFNVHATRKVK